MCYSAQGFELGMKQERVARGKLPRRGCHSRGAHQASPALKSTIPCDTSPSRRPAARFLHPRRGSWSQDPLTNVVPELALMSIHQSLLSQHQSRGCTFRGAEAQDQRLQSQLPLLQSQLPQGQEVNHPRRGYHFRAADVARIGDICWLAKPT